MDSNKLLEESKSGNIESFNKLFTELRPKLKAYLFRITANRDDTEDYTQEVFINAFQNIKSFRGEASLKTWIFTIATNLCLKELKHRKKWYEDTMQRSRKLAHRETDYLKALDYANQYAPKGTYEIKEHIDYCFTCTTKMLSIEEQVALILKDVFLFKVAEVAKIMEKSAGTIKHLLYEGRNKMMEIFDDQCRLISKKGVCNQCSELNGKFNPKQDSREKLMKIKFVKENDKKSKSRLYALRTKLIQAIDPLGGEGTDLHEVFLKIATKANEAG